MRPDLTSSLHHNIQNTEHHLCDLQREISGGQGGARLPVWNVARSEDTHTLTLTHDVGLGGAGLQGEHPAVHGEEEAGGKPGHPAVLLHLHPLPVLLTPSQVSQDWGGGHVLPERCVD